jgi:hypothetical protein
LQRASISHTLSLMEVHFTPGQEAQLRQIATSADTDAERLVNDAAFLRRLERAMRAFVRPFPAEWLPRCVPYALASNLIPKAGQCAMASTMDAI